MPLFNKHRNPTDPRWQGGQRIGPILMLPITGIWMILWIMVIANAAYAKKLIGEAREAKETSQLYDQNEQWVPPEHAGAELVIAAMWALAPDTIHIPLQHILIHKSHMHPVTALLLSLSFASLYFFSGLITIGRGIVGQSDAWDGSNSDRWVGVLYTCGALEWIVGILYLVYFGFAVTAVARWRRSRKGNGNGQGKPLYQPVNWGNPDV